MLNKDFGIVDMDSTGRAEFFFKGLGQDHHQLVLEYTTLFIGIIIAQLTWPMAKRLKLFGITYLVGKIKFELFFSGSRTAE